MEELTSTLLQEYESKMSLSPYSTLNHAPAHVFSLGGGESASQSFLSSASSSVVSSITATKNELFVGDLSFFCTEKDLYELFNEIGKVETCCIAHKDDKNKSLMFGFITMSTHDEAAVAVSMYNNQLFMGRSIKVEFSEKRQSPCPNNNSAFITNGFQLHLSFSSNFPADSVIRPTEMFLRDFFTRFGKLIDVVVREYSVYSGMNKQAGFGFLTFEDEESAVRAAHHCKSILVEGVLISSKLSYRNRPTGRIYDVGGGAIYVSQGPSSADKMTSNAATHAPRDPQLPLYPYQQRTAPPSVPVHPYAQRHAGPYMAIAQVSSLATPGIAFPPTPPPSNSAAHYTANRPIAIVPSFAPTPTRRQPEQRYGHASISYAVTMPPNSATPFHDATMYRHENAATIMRSSYSPHIAANDSSSLSYFTEASKTFSSMVDRDAVYAAHMKYTQQQSNGFTQNESSSVANDYSSPSSPSNGTNSNAFGGNHHYPNQLLMSLNM